MKVQEVKIESKSEMEEYLMRSGLNYLVFGRDSEVEGGLYILRWCSNENRELIIGIISEGHGLKPEYKCFEDKILIGFNREVKIINSIGDYKTIKSNSLFYEFADISNINEIVAIFELEIKCFSIDGREKWVHFTNVINDYYIDDSSMHIITDDGEEIVSLETGN